MSFHNLLFLSISPIFNSSSIAPPHFHPLPPPSLGGPTPWSSITSHQLYMWYRTGFLWGHLNMESGVLLQDVKDTGRPSVRSPILVMCLHPDSCHFINSSRSHWMKHVVDFQLCLHVFDFWLMVLNLLLYVRNASVDGSGLTNMFD